MDHIDDADLLGRYAVGRDEQAFDALVRRHVDGVYSSALRRVGGDTHLAEDVAQHVFAALAHDAKSLCRHPALTGWLYTATRFAAANVVRSERRRKAKEEKVYAMHNVSIGTTGAPEADWSTVGPILDKVLDHLGERDRTAVILRFMVHRTFAEIGSALQLSEDAARMRIDRALDRLREALARRGIMSSSAALAVVLTGNCVLGAPAGLASAVISNAVSSATVATPSVLKVLHAMFAAKITSGISSSFAFVGVLSIAVIGVATYQYREAQSAESLLIHAQRQSQVQQLKLNELERKAQAADVRLASLKAKLDQVRMTVTEASRQTTVNAAGSAQVRDPRVDGETFMKTYPQTRAMLIELSKAQLRRNLAPYYRAAGLTVEQIGAFEDRSAAYWLDHVVVTPTSVRPSVNLLPDDQVRELLGDEAVTHLQEYNRKMSAYVVTLQAAIVAGYAAAPVPFDKTDQLVQIIADASSAYRKGGAMTIDTVDWDSVVAQAPSMFSPEQWAAMQSIFLYGQFLQSLNEARREISAEARNETKPD